MSFLVLGQVSKSFGETWTLLILIAFSFISFLPPHKMEYGDHTVPRLGKHLKDWGVMDYYGKRKAELIAMLRVSDHQPSPQLQTWEPTRPQYSTRPLHRPQLVRFRPDRSKQPELLRHPKSVRKPTTQEMDIFKHQMSKSRSQVKDKLNKWYNWLASHIPEPIKEKASRTFKAVRDKIMRLYKRFKGKEPEEESFNPVEHWTKIKLTKNQTRVISYEVTGSLNHDVSNLILDTVCPVTEMQMRVIYGFSCSTYQGQNQVVQYHKTLYPNGTFMSLSQVKEYIGQCDLWHLILDVERV